MSRIFWMVVLLACAVNLHAQEDNVLLTMPGKLVSIGTHRLHINCTGSGEPTVIMDSGLGGFSLEWDSIQTGLSEKMRVCSYDRAGYGWSDPGPEPRTTQQIAFELKSLLSNAQIPGPYILVGHSFGGYNIRYYASIYPQDVLGLVLVDASHPQQFERLPQAEVKTEIKHKNSWTVRLSSPVIPDNYPERAKRLAYLLMANYKATQARMQEWDSFKTSADQVAVSNNLPDVPLTVITRGMRAWPQNEFGDKSEKVWSELQSELCRLTSHTDHLIAKRSGHLVHLDEPELVASAILKTVASANKLEEIRLAKLLQEKTLPDKNMLLVSNNHLRSSNNKYVNPLYGIYTRAGDIQHASFLLPY